MIEETVPILPGSPPMRPARHQHLPGCHLAEDMSYRQALFLAVIEGLAGNATLAHEAPKALAGRAAEIVDALLGDLAGPLM